MRGTNTHTHTHMHAQAGFEDPMLEVKKRVAEKASTSSSAKELLASIRPYASPEFHTALMEALAAVEAEGESVSLDGASAGYKKFAEKVKVGVYGTAGRLGVRAAAGV